MAVDKAVSDTSKDKVERNKQWLKIRSEDVFIDKTVQILNSMIVQSNVVKSN